jgi:predicted DNA-binding protein (MmcQ/YjbR family)
MNIESFRTYCLAKKSVTEETPFGPEVLVLKVAGKMFALASIDEFNGISLKVDPGNGVSLREQYSSIVPAFHMNKLHWITVMMRGDVSDKLARQLIDDSYNLVVDGLPKKIRVKLKDTLA